MRRKISILKSLKIVLLVVLLSGCTRMPISVSKMIYLSPIPPSKTETFSMQIIDRNQIGRPYKIIGLIQAQGYGQSKDEIVEQLKREARKLGGDAMIDLQQGYENTEVLDPKQKFIMKRPFSAKVIVWENP